VSVNNLADIRRLLGGYSPGAWFHASDRLGYKPGPRPYILPEGWDEGPTAVAMPRTTKICERADHVHHPPHDAGHQVGCRVNAPGDIVLRRWTLTSAELDGYLCDEPDHDLVERLRVWRRAR
jgi:hypothetical protein